MIGIIVLIRSVNKMISKVGAGIILIGVIIMIAAFAVPSLTIVTIGSTSGGGGYNYGKSSR